jgi:predicted TIM-barrel fold metal-dependent hydrolase
VPFLLEAMDWQFIGGAVRDERPDLDLLPSEYFRRQIYACFWFESTAPRRLLDVIGYKNVLFETDFPHPTSLYPAKTVREHVAACLAEQPEEVRRAVLHDNAAELYHLDF